MELHNGSSSQIPNIPVEEKDLKFKRCSCSCETFYNATKLGALSAVHPKNITGKEQLVAVPVIVCTSCGEVFKNQEKKEG